MPKREMCAYCGKHPSTSFDYVRHSYGVPAARGMRVTAYGKPGVITRGRGAHLGIRLDGEKRVGVYHPTSEIIYHTKHGDFIPDCAAPWLGRGNEAWGEVPR